MTGFGSLFYFRERIFLGCSGIQTDFHSHYAASILFSESKPFLLHNETNTLTTHAIVLPPNYFHKLDAPQTNIFVIQLDPKTEEYKSLKLDKEPKLIPDKTANTISELAKPILYGDINCESVKQLYAKILNELGSSSNIETELDPRIAQAIEIISHVLPEGIRIKEISEQTGLSPDRFMHLFKENMGIPLRQFLLWKRLHIAAKHLQTGGNLTEASHSAGFSDQAHLSRTFKKMFGVKPSLFLGGSQLKKVCFC